jgi:hypothetical protein
VTVAETLALPTVVEDALIVTIVDAPAASAVSVHATVLAVFVQVPPDVMTLATLAPVTVAVKSMGEGSPETLRTVAVY